MNYLLLLEHNNKNQCKFLSCTSISDWYVYDDSICEKVLSKIVYALCKYIIIRNCYSRLKISFYWLFWWILVTQLNWAFLPWWMKPKCHTQKSMQTLVRWYVITTGNMTADIYRHKNIAISLIGYVHEECRTSLIYKLSILIGRFVPFLIFAWIWNIST